MFAVPKGLLCHFSPVHRQKLVVEQEKVVILEKSDKRSVSWVLRWMLAGGTDKTGTSSEILDDDEAVMDLLLRRLQVVDQLRLGQLCEEISTKLRNHFAKSSVTGDQIRWVYSRGLGLTRNGLRATLAEGLLDSVLDYELWYAFDIFHNEPTLYHDIHYEPMLYHDMVLRVDSPETVKRVGAMQQYGPLTVHQIEFLYELSAVNGHLRKTIAHGLLRLLDDDLVEEPQTYRTYAWHNNDFEEDMVAAMRSKERAAEHAQFLERKARREARAAASQQAAQSKVAKSAQGSGYRGPLASGAPKATSAKGSNGLKASGSSKVEPAPVKPGQRLKSNTVLKLDATGTVTRER